VTGVLLPGGPPGPATGPSHLRVTAPARLRPSTEITNIRAFYRGYSAALRHGRGALDALYRAHMASWYVPILEAPAVPGGNTVTCGAPKPARDLRYQQGAGAGGQAVVVARWSTSAQVTYIMIMAQPRTGKITGISCAGSGSDVTTAGARDAVTSVFPRYARARRNGTSVHDALAELISSGGPNWESPYLRQLQGAISRGLSYDPVLCSRGRVHGVTVGSATLAGHGSAGLVVVTPRGSRPVLAVITLGAKGLAVAGIACQRP
jgi:hypothetical protein